MMEKTTLQLIRKVEEKNKKPANKIESKPGWVPENTESRPSIKKLKTCKKESYENQTKNEKRTPSEYDDKFK